MEKKMTRSALETTISKSTGYTRGTVKAVLDEFIGTVADTLDSGGSVTVTGLGKFEMRKMARKHYTNPRTKDCQMLPERSRPAFKFSSTFKASIKK